MNGVGSESGSSRRGHRLLPHTADCIIEAWGPDRSSCLAEATKALVDAFAEVSETAASRPLPISVDGSSDRDVLVSLLEEVIYTTEVFGVVPTRVDLAEIDDGAVSGIMEVVDACDVELVGPVPKAVSYHGLEMGEEGGAWKCRAIVDV